VFQLNKAVILAARKLETGPFENYMHVATQLHRLNLLLFEFNSAKQLKNVLSIINTEKLRDAVLDYTMNTDAFSHFGLRFFELLAVHYPEQVIQSDLLAVVQGLLRTND